MYNTKEKNLIFIIPFAAFSLLFLVGLTLPLRLTPHYGNYMSRIWSWTQILIALAAAYYRIRSKTFNRGQIIISVLLGALCLVALFRDPRYLDIIITSICAALTFYGACRLFDQTNVENRSLDLGIAGGMKYFILGAVISIPLAFLNIFYFSLQGPIHVGNIFYSAVSALKPAVSEEIIFRYFLLAYAYHLLHGKVTERFLSIYTYILLVIPHTLLHYPDLFLASPINGFLMLALNSVVFGLPMALLMKRKNLQMAAGMQWKVG